MSEEKKDEQSSMGKWEEVPAIFTIDALTALRVNPAPIGADVAEEKLRFLTFEATREEVIQAGIRALQDRTHPKYFDWREELASRSRAEGGHGEQESAILPPLTAPAPMTDELRKLVNAHCNDLLDCAAVLHDDGRFKRTAEEIRTAVAELRAVMKAALAPQQSELSDKRILQLQIEHIPKHGWSTNGIEFARAIEREVLAKAAPAAPVQTVAVPNEWRTTMANLAAIVRVQNGNLYADTNEILAQAEKCLAAQAEQAQVEPVAYMWEEDRSTPDSHLGPTEHATEICFDTDPPIEGTSYIALYDHPAQVEQVAAVRAATFEEAAAMCACATANRRPVYAKDMADRFRALAKEAAAVEAPSQDQADAARYRWLRDYPWSFELPELAQIIQLQSNALWDSAIDAAMSGEQSPQSDMGGGARTPSTSEASKGESA
jgi:hypothetical protein